MAFPGRPLVSVVAAVLSLRGGAAAQSPADTALAASFASPPITARPMVLWPWLNGFVDHAQLTHELEEMRQKGLRGPIIWDIGSLADPEHTIPAGPPFLGPESLASIHHVLDEAARLGLEVGLVASSSWNAGGPWIGPELASKELRWAERTVSGPTTFAGALPAPEPANAPFTDVAVVAVPTAAVAGGARGEPGTKDLTGTVGADGTLTWDVPPGEWTILRFVCCCTGQPLVCPSPGSSGPIVDHMSAAATDRHFTEICDRLFAGREALPALKLLMLDSFEVWPRVDWTPDFGREFAATFGYDLAPWLPALADKPIGEPALRERFLHDYRALVGHRMVRDHFGRAAKLLEPRGLQLLAEAGHGGYPRFGALEALGAAHIPMGEFWNGKQFWVTKEAASAAHVYGRTDVAAESLTGWRHWQDGPEEYRRLFDIAFCAGLNRPVFHTFAHNPPSAGRPGFAYHAGEHFNVNSTWWPQAGPFVTYLARCCHMLRQGRFVGDVCFYYGDDAPNLVPSRRIDPKVAPPHAAGECQHCGRPMPCRTEGLGAGYDYDYVSADLVLGDMQVHDGRIALSSGMEYRLLALPDRDDIAVPVLRRLEELVRGGATLVGRRPVRASGLAGYPQCDDEVRRLAAVLWGDGNAAPHRHGEGRVFATADLRGVLQGLGVQPDFTVDSPAPQALDYVHRRTDTADIYFVCNSSDAPVFAECSFRVPATAVPSLWNPEDGSITPCAVFRRADGQTRVPVALPPVGSTFVVFRSGDDDDHVVDLGRTDRSEPRLVDPDIEVVGLRGDSLRIRAQAAGTYSVTTARGRTATATTAEPPAALAPAVPWQIEFPAAKATGEPIALELERLTSWTEFADDDARYFAGTALYRTEFDVPTTSLTAGRVLTLDLGDVAEIAEVAIDGAPPITLWKAPYRADVTHLLHPGRNRLEVRVTNLWHNRIVGDLRSPAAPPRATTNLKGRFRADTPLLPSGLLGPVALKTAVVIDVPLR